MNRLTILLFHMVLLAFLLVPARDLFAESAITCHCFQERAYNPAEPFAADDYILASSFNSFLARTFDIAKKQIVMLKMKQGVEQDDLLIGLKIAKAAGIDLDKLLSSRRTEQWPQIISGLVGDGTVHSDPVLQTIRSGNDHEAATRVAEEAITAFYGIPIDEIEGLRRSGLDEREMPLLLVLAYASNREPAALARQHEEKGMSWSGIAYSLGIEPGRAGELILHYPARELPE